MALTPTSVEAPDDAVDFRSHNRELFARRSELKERVAALRCASQGATGRGLRRLTRQLDDVTSEIVEVNSGLVHSCVRQFTARKSRHEVDDFVAAGLVGLMRALDSYDPERGSFANWAYNFVKNEVLKAVRDADHKTISHSDFEARPAVLRAAKLLAEASGDDGDAPSAEAIAAHTSLPVAQVRRVLDAPFVESMHRPVSGDDATVELGDLIETDDINIEDEVLTASSLESVKRFGLPALNARELHVLCRRFGLDGEPPQKLAQIGGLMDLSREGVRQLENRALAKLQHPVVLRRIVRDGRR